jgi:hypothetical protein
MNYTVTLQEDENGDLILPIPQEILDQTGWHEGTVLEFKDCSDGSFTLSKAYGPLIDDMLLNLVGSHTLVDAWWNSPNKHFQYAKPIDCDHKKVYEYVLSYNNYPS